MPFVSLLRADGCNVSDEMEECLTEFEPGILSDAIDFTALFQNTFLCKVIR